MLRTPWLYHHCVAIRQQSHVTQEMENDVIVIRGHYCVFIVHTCANVICPSVELVFSAEYEVARENSLEPISLFSLHCPRQFYFDLHYSLRLDFSTVEVVIANQGVRSKSDLRISRPGRQSHLPRSVEPELLGVLLRNALANTTADVNKRHERCSEQKARHYAGKVIQ
jgi:hypothetical protein